MELSAQQANIRSDVQSALRSFFALRAQQLADISGELPSVIAELSQLVLSGGKRLRPTFAYWGWHGAGGGDIDREAAVAAAASLELIQACALIHDDVMDGSLTRRGKPAMHRRFAALHREGFGRGDADSHGVAVAILLGDFALAWADELLRGSGFSDSQLSAAWPIFEQMRTELMAGQYLDLASQAYGDHCVARARQVAVFKSAKYTIERPLHLGAALAAGSQDTMRAYTKYGIPLGEAFQLRDDVLGIFGDPAKTGKPTGDDLREGKRTVLVAAAFERADAAQRSVLERGLGDAGLTEAAVDKIREIFVETGALAELEVMISALTERALDALEEAGTRGYIEPLALEALGALAVATTARVS
ncbi:MAG: polyprenyl synthetase [Acidimicrobiales bacterium]|nr:MAG: polyprenyl synthetase [Acidimicrobiales bacterium]